jgi:hypothetical protein
MHPPTIDTTHMVDQCLIQADVHSWLQYFRKRTETATSAFTI